MADASFATAINCMDGRVQLPVIEYLKKNYGVQYVDMITEAGPDGLLAIGSTLIENIRKRVAVSVEKHGSRVIMVAGHADCAGNPVGENEHRKNIEKSVEVVASWDFPAKVVGAWLGEGFKVEIIGK